MQKKTLKSRGTQQGKATKLIGTGKIAPCPMASGVLKTSGTQIQDFHGVTMHNTEDNRFMTTSEVARMLNIHVNTVRRWSGLGIIKSHRIGPRSDRRFAKDDVVHFLITEQNEINSPEIEKGSFSEGANNNGNSDCS